MDIPNHVYTIWTITRDKDHHHVRVNSIGGPSGNACTIELGKKRMQLLLDFYNAKKVNKLKGKTFESPEATGAAALFDFLLRVLQVD